MPGLEYSADMFERYTEKARRSIFFARYEASQFGSPSIETEHLLLGLLREDPGAADELLARYGFIPSGQVIELPELTDITAVERTTSS